MLPDKNGHPAYDFAWDAASGCPRVDSNHHAFRHRPSTCCVYHSATRALRVNELRNHITPIPPVCQRVYWPRCRPFLKIHGIRGEPPLSSPHTPIASFFSLSTLPPKRRALAMSAAPFLVQFQQPFARWFRLSEKLWLLYHRDLRG